MHLLVEVLGAGAQHELLVDLHVELGALRLQLPATCRRTRIRALQENGEKRRLVRAETINPVSEWAINPEECGFQFQSVEVLWHGSVPSSEHLDTLSMHSYIVDIYPSRQWAICRGRHTPPVVGSSKNQRLARHRRISHRDSHFDWGKGKGISKMRIEPPRRSIDRVPMYCVIAHAEDRGWGIRQC